MSIALKVNRPAGCLSEPLETLYLKRVQEFPRPGLREGLDKDYRKALQDIVAFEQQVDGQLRETLEQYEELYAKLEGIAMRAFYEFGFRDGLKLAGGPGGA